MPNEKPKPLADQDKVHSSEQDLRFLKGPGTGEHELTLWECRHSPTMVINQFPIMPSTRRQEF